MEPSDVENASPVFWNGFGIGPILFVEKKKDNGEMLNIFLRDDTHGFKSSVDQSKTIIAKRGYMTKRNEQNFLVLFDGTIQTEKKNGKINFLKFKKTEFN